MAFTRTFLGVLIFLLMVSSMSFGQSINAGNDTIICLNDQAKLHSTLTGGGYGTDSYTFEVFPYSPEPYTGGTGVTFGGNQDDQVAGPFDLGFTFCFFNQTYTQFYIGSNGWIGFTYNAAWTTFTSTPIPNTSPAVPKNCIMAPWEDWWPGYTGSLNPGVYYYQTGTAPNRKLVVYWPESKQYGCRDLLIADRGRFQIVINEQSSIIENHISNKPLCSNQTATQGVQNLAGTVGFTATGRNSTLWTAANESTRFVPSGIKWYTGGYPGGTIVGYGPSLFVSPLVTTTYTVVVQTCGGGTSTDNVTVTVVNAGFSYPAYSYCAGSPNVSATTLQPGGTFTAVPAGLSISSTTGEINVAASTPGNYTIKYTLTGACATSINKNFEIKALPVPVISGSIDVCQGSTGNVYSTQPGMTNYQWQISPGGTITSGGTFTNNTATVTWGMAGAQTISVKYTDNKGCIALIPIIYNVTVHASVIPSLTGPVSVCMNQISTFSTETGMSNYLWTVAGGNITSGSTTSSITVQWLASGIQTVNVIYNDPVGCTPSTPATVNVTVKDIPYPTITGLTVFCLGTTQTYTTEAGMNGYVWNVSAGGTILSGGGSSDPSVTVNWSGAGAQSVSVNYSLSNGCSALTPVIKNIMVNPSLIPSVIGNNAICMETSVVYTAQPGMSGYLWTVSSGGTVTSGGTAADNTVTVLWNASGIQSVSVNYTDGNGCTAIAPFSFPVTVYATPVPAIVGPASVCWNTSASYSTAPGMSNYLWTISTGGTITSGSGTSLVTILWSTPGTKTITLNYTNGNGCSGASATSYTVDVSVLPVPTLTGNNSVCQGLSSTYITEAGMNNYAWNISAGGTVTAGGSATDPTITVLWNTTGPQTVSVNYVVGASCSPPSPATININVKPVPILTNSLNNPPICSGTPTAINLQSSIPGSTFSWISSSGSPSLTGFSDGSGNQIIQTLTSSSYATEYVIYHVTATANACSGPVTNDTIFVKPTPDVILSPPSQTLCGGQTTGISLTSNVASASFSWTATPGSLNVSGFSSGTGNSIVQTLNTPGITVETVTYHVTPIANACTGLVADAVVTIVPKPHLTTSPMNQTICSEGLTSISLVATTPGTVFNWTVSVVAGNVTGQLPGSGNLISQNLTSLSPVTGQLAYLISMSAGTCAGNDTVFDVFVKAKPQVLTASPDTMICSGTSTAVHLNSDVTGAAFTWTTTGSSAFVTGFTAGSGNIIANTLTNTGITDETVTYAITPGANGCNGNIFTYPVTVHPVANVSFVPPSQTICSGASSNISLQSQVAGASFTWTAAGSTLNVSGFSNGSGNSINQNLTNTGSVPETVTYLVTPVAYACNGTALPVVITVNPQPVITTLPIYQALCSGALAGINLTSNTTGTTYAWTAASTSPALTGFSNGSGNSISQTLTNSGFTIDTVIYSVTASANGCPGVPVNFLMAVSPAADVIFTPATQSFCTGSTTNILVSSNVAGSTYTWSATGSSGNITGYTAGSGNMIQQTLSNSGFNIETVTYSVMPVANGCPGVLKSAVVSVNPFPSVAFSLCNDLITTIDAKPFLLKGGTPTGGTYAGTGVSAGIFNPAFAGAGTHVLTYTYNNTWGCRDSLTQSITVLTPSAFVCGAPVTDPRDNQSYPTIKIGTQCWMASNLNYGSVIPSGAMQRDNCSPEKYCFNDNPASCTTRGGLYQWDELMQFDNTKSVQGLCPPSWHIPADTEWNTLFNFYNGIAIAAAPLGSAGFSGFNAMLYGSRFDNTNWNFSNFATFFWTSDLLGPYKARAHGMNNIDISVSTYPSNRSNAFSVRCVKD